MKRTLLYRKKCWNIERLKHHDVKHHDVKPPMNIVLCEKCQCAKEIVLGIWKLWHRSAIMKLLTETFVLEKSSVVNKRQKQKCFFSFFYLQLKSKWKEKRYTANLIASCAGMKCVERQNRDVVNKARQINMLSVTNTHNNQNFCQEICAHRIEV